MIGTPLTKKTSAPNCRQVHVPGWLEATGDVAGEVTGVVAGEVLRLLEVLATQGPMGRGQAQEALSLKSEANFRERYLAPAFSAGLVDMTLPDKPRSRLQQYRLTPAGLVRLKHNEANGERPKATSQEENLQPEYDLRRLRVVAKGSGRRSRTAE